MKAIKKSEVNIFGEKSNAEIIKVGFFSYGVKRICDGAILAKSAKFRKYRNDINKVYKARFKDGQKVKVVFDTRGTKKKSDDRIISVRIVKGKRS